MNIQHQAWTGGVKPPPYSTLTRHDKYIVSEIFRDHATTYIARWGKMDWFAARTFWAWARYDALSVKRRGAE